MRKLRMKAMMSSLVFAVCFQFGICQVRTDADVMEIARDFLNAHSDGGTELISIPLRKIANKAKDQFIEAPSLQDLQKGDGIHIITDTKRQSFVLISGDERMKPVLGYSLNSVFNIDYIAPGLIDLIAGYQETFNRLQEFNSTKKVPEYRSTIAIEPLIKTKWNQGFPYNMFCPTVGEKASVTGCVATAIAQVLKYYDMPYNATGYIAYETEKCGYIEANLSSIPLDWENMINTYTDNNSDIQNESVAHLMQACGYSVYMEYNYPESSALSLNIPYALINNFCYNKNITYKERAYYSIDEWLKMIDSEIDASRPVLYSGVNKIELGDRIYNLGGHQFILDGRDEQGMYHINFGWGGEYDGYYTLDAIAFSNSNFVLYNYNQSMITGISPETHGVHEDIFYAPEFSFKSLSAYNTSQISCKLSYFCYSSDAQTYTLKQGESFKGEVGIGLFDDNFNFIKPLYSSHEELLIGQGKGGSVNIQFDKNTFKNGSSYIIALYAKGDHSDCVTPMRTQGGMEDWYRATTQNDHVTLTLLGLPDSITLITGNYGALAYDAEDKEYRWQMSIRKDDNEDNKYWLNDIDPTVSAMGYSYDQGWNKVYGILNNTGTRLIIPGNQTVGDNIQLRSIVNNDDITFIVSSDGDYLTATEAWGSFSNGEAISTYSNTELVHGILDSDVIDNPIIVWDEKSLKATITTTTDDANVYYTLDGKTPTLASLFYTEPFSIDHNCIISAIAEKNGKVSDVIEFNVNTFTVESPLIEIKERFIHINCNTSGANIYYTLDGSDPNKQSIVYSEPIGFTKTLRIKAFATKPDFNDSPVVEKTVYGFDSDPIVVENNIAGNLNNRIGDDSKLTIESLTVSGDLNGTDIKYIREMLINGELSTLILTDANIVSGGDHYYETSILSYDTKDNVIGSSMFYGTKKLVTLKLPNSVKMIDMFGVSDNDNLLELVLPDACEKLNDYSLSNNKCLSMFTLPRSIKEFTAKAFASCDNLNSINVDPNNSYFTSVDGVLFSKDKECLIWYSSCRNEESYNIPAGVTTLGEGCFAKSRLRKVEMPEGLRIIQSSAFNSCEYLNSVKFPSSLSEIGMFAFSDCNIFNLDLANVTKIEMYAFDGNKNLTMVHIGKSMKSLSGLAFNRCMQLKNYEVDEDNEYYCAIDGVLFNKSQSQLIKFPTAKVIAIYVVPSTVEKIDEYSFSSCNYVKTIIIDTNLEEIGASAFDHSKCESIRMESNSNISKIGMFAFNNCENIQSLIIPDKVEVIPMSCASGCKSLEYLKLPASIKEIGSSAFFKCNKLVTIDCGVEDMAQVQLEKNYNGEYNSFTEIDPNCQWIVPEGSSNSYRNSPWWISTWRIKENVDCITDMMFTHNCKIDICENGIEITSPIDNTIFIYNINGTLVDVIKCIAGVSHRVDLTSGIYIIGGNKIAIL